MFLRERGRRGIMKEYDVTMLAEADGKEGRPALVACRGRVIDVSASKLWKTGLHMKRHRAGSDLSADIQAAPHGPEVLDRYPQVGILKEKEVPERPMPLFLARLLKRFPFLRRHPHPMAVHFPIALIVAAALFNLLYCAVGLPSFEVTAFHCLGAGVIFAVPAILTGFFTWWLNYQAKPLRAVTVKIGASVMLIIVGVAALTWRIVDSGMMMSLRGEGVVYLVLVLILVLLVSLIGWYGGRLTFPDGTD